MNNQVKEAPLPADFHRKAERLMSGKQAVKVLYIDGTTETFNDVVDGVAYSTISERKVLVFTMRTRAEVAARSAFECGAYWRIAVVTIDHSQVRRWTVVYDAALDASEK
jgi:hypothetical protein